jgi:hypothetical protein
LFQKKDADKPLFGKARVTFSKNVAESKKTKNAKIPQPSDGARLQN